MRNLKKILALALVFAMAFTFTASAADFTDKAEIGAKYVDDVNMLVELGVIAGYPDGSFGPAKNITRAEFAKMAYTIKYGSDTDGNLFAAQKSNFWDVEGNASVAWAKGYINYCANQNIVSGVGGGKFNPSGNITVAEATKMLLVILGCDPAKEGFTGANWVANVTAKAIDLGIYNGWTGDPSQLATRELVAKLMRNTIFSSVYTYSAITGMGSQMNALGTGYNKTLGATTMGLQTVTGIVVANERYFIDTDEEGVSITGVTGVGAATGVDSGESVIYYEYQNDEGDTVPATIKIDRALDDDMLGAKVNVFFKADRIESNKDNRKDYKNIEVIGNVLVHSDTVAYTVPAIATDIMPDGDSTSTSEIRPYITFQVDGVEKQIKMSSEVKKVAKDTDAQDDPNADLYNEINKYAYVIEGASLEDDGDLDNATGDEFVAEMGAPVLSQYRFVSVDGGNTYSYMFKMVDEEQNTAYASVTSYSEAAGTIRLQGAAYDLEEVVLNDEVAIDDVVVAYRVNGKIVVDKVDVFTAGVDGFTDEDDGVILSGVDYYKWSDCDLDGYLTFFDYYQENRAAMNSCKYYVYNGIVMEINAEGIESDTAVTSDYAVILRSYYDSDLDTAYVKLGFADNTEATYAVGKLYKKKASNPQSALNDLASDFNMNAYVGMVVNYKILDDGTVDLSGQYFKDDEYLRYYADGTDVLGYYDANGMYQVSTAKKTSTIKVDDGKIVFDRDIEGELSTKEAEEIAGAIEEATYYAINDSVVVFAIYGQPNYAKNDSTGEIYIDTKTTGYLPLKSRAYKLSDIKDITPSDISSLYVNFAGNGQLGAEVGHVVLNSKTATNKYVLAASMTVGGSTAGITYQESSALAYLASARQYYNANSGKYYASLVLINEDGTITTTTIEDVKDLNNASVLVKETVGNIDGKGDTLPAGSFVRFNINSDGKVDVLTIEGGHKWKDVKKAYAGDSSGLFLVNMTGVRGDIYSFYNADQTIAVDEADLLSLEAHEDDGCVVIAVAEDGYAGSVLAKLPTRETTLTANKGNAVIQVEEGQIVRVFSFAEGYTLN